LQIIQSKSNSKSGTAFLLTAAFFAPFSVEAAVAAFGATTVFVGIGCCLMVAAGGGSENNGSQAFDNDWLTDSS
jgi:hypothetical protein